LKILDRRFFYDELDRRKMGVLFHKQAAPVQVAVGSELLIL
jgi:hypothetical protein